jgi:hypothetical protein
MEKKLTWWIVHARNKVPRSDRGPRSARSRTTANSGSTFPDNLREMAPVLESLIVDIEVINTVTWEVEDFGIVPHVADDGGKVTGSHVGTLGDVHTDTGSVRWTV